MTDLLEAMEALTKPRHSKAVQTNEAGITCTSPIELPSLLEQLDESIRSNMGGSTHGGSDPATRSLADAGALMKMMQISSQVMDWARIVGSVIDKQSTPVTLTRWYVRYNEYPHSGEMSASYTRQLHKWAAQIEATLDPPREKDLDSPCPSCGATEWWDPATKERYHRPLVIRYRPDSDSMVNDARGICRACATTWGVRELQFEIEEAEHQRAAGREVA